ncbi:quinolinate synthase [candidate division WOR-1 bacterium RIFOXYA2_FULL_36_21]|uniref:Quinolinate synthase n=1 Tax=candidate division WOR-1 bacterium RIFOXYB2_FULL_36_35 TaxID=1802578 RepID=A0A1F4S4B4_UNCSA|nr:MAG: quinolinate synthase [candidate division WOR-1 bacterium RIFOXYA2_FULL_36_21]OGC14245.1 MAG: quinolinate synthase [candidate division WOR-1 bacterium RIFOXYA12_FULL_36_13]OGC15250.1 MAG: quinolinate synthase [candidate division WOR-1 bacterium RIFOXYB2_FULL_36_35]
MTNPLLEKINKLKVSRNAVILAHNYQLGEIQDAADFVGDSLELSIKASQITNADLIVFCGVYFMAETAKILSPTKTVIMPDINAGCPMANMITGEDVRKLKRDNPDAKVVCYVNSTAQVKAESDICCTSANTQKIVESIKETGEIIFIPDKYLGMNTAKKVPDKKFIYWNGYCPTHMKIMPQDIEKAKNEHPSAVVIVHPECRTDVVELADHALSTGGMLKFAKESSANEIIVGTEIGMLHRLQKENPDKKFYPVTDKAVCPNMKLTTLEKLLWALEEVKTEITVEKDVADRARKAIERMIENR